MRSFQKRAVVAGCIGAALLLALLARAWLFRPADPRHNYDLIHEGVTTEAEVEAMYGPSAKAVPMELTPNMARLRGLPVRPDGPPITVTVKLWWYDDDHSFQLEIDERGIVLLKSLPALDGPRSPVRRWMKDLTGWRF